MKWWTVEKLKSKQATGLSTQSSLFCKCGCGGRVGGWEGNFSTFQHVTLSTCNLSTCQIQLSNCSTFQLFNCSTSGNARLVNLFLFNLSTFSYSTVSTFQLWRPFDSRIVLHRGSWQVEQLKHVEKLWSWKVETVAKLKSWNVETFLKHILTFHMFIISFFKNFSTVQLNSFSTFKFSTFQVSTCHTFQLFNFWTSPYKYNTFDLSTFNFNFHSWSI